VINEVRINREAAYRFFGTFPAMRGNILELGKILFARQITSLSDDDLRLKIEEIRQKQLTESKTPKNNYRPSEQGPAGPRFGHVRKSESSYLTGSFNPWLLSCPRLYDADYRIADCTNDLQSWAALVLKSAVG